MPFELPFLSVCPRVEAEEGVLTATTPWLIRILTLDAYYRRVVVSRIAKSVFIERRLFWGFREHQVYEFDQIYAVTYGYQDDAIASDFTAHDSVDDFLVGLRLHNGEELPLFRFVGDGSFTNNSSFSDVWYAEDIVTDCSGTQEEESKQFVYRLSKFIGVTVVPSKLVGD